MCHRSLENIICLNEALSVWADLCGVHGSIILIKTDYFVVTMLSGTNQYNFFDYGKQKNTHLPVLPAMLNWDPGPWTLNSEV